MAKGAQAGQEFLQRVLGKITDPDLKAAAEKVFADATVQTEIGGGVLGQSEIDRQLQELRTKTTDLETKAADLAETETRLNAWHGDLTTWHKDNQEYIRLGKAAKANGGKLPADGEKPAAAAGGVTKDDLDAALRAELGGALNFNLEQNRLMIAHHEKFGKILDIMPLVQHPKIRELGLEGVYNLVHKEALDAHQAAEDKKREEAIRADERSKVASAMPYPNPTGSGSGSPLDALKPTSTPVVDEAVAEYHRIQATRAAAGA